jgi:hypothetical protein
MEEKRCSIIIKGLRLKQMNVAFSTERGSSNKTWQETLAEEEEI